MKTRAGRSTPHVLSFLAAVLAVLSFAPSLAFAATFAEKRTLVISEAPPDNAYLAGSNVSIRTPLPADLVVAAGNLNVLAPVAGDVLAAAGSLDIEEAVNRNVRAAAGRIDVNGPVANDLVVAGGTVNVAGHAHDMRIFGGTVNVSGGSDGMATIYGADVTLSGEYGGDVEVVASDRFTLAPGTHIHGALHYNAPQKVDVPDDATVDGGVTYTGSYSYVPTNAEARRYALLGSGIFFIVRAVALMIAAALLAGLFPAFAALVSERALAATLRRTSLFALLGFGLLVATPVLVLLLLVSFVGGAIAIVLGLAYVLALILSYLLAGVIVGAAIRQRFRPHRIAGLVSWKDALLGMFVLFLFGSIPFVGWLIGLVMLCLAFGILAAVFYGYAFDTGPDVDEF